MMGKNKRGARRENGICRGIKALRACWLVPYPAAHSCGPVGKTLRSSSCKQLQVLGVPCAATITLEESHLNPFSELSCLTYCIPADLLNLWQGGRACGLTAGKSVPPTALALLPPTRSPSYCPTRSACWRLIKEAALSTANSWDLVI